MKRAWILGAITGCGLLAISVMGQQTPASGVGAIEKVADRVYRIPGAGGNSAVFVRADGVLLVDTKLSGNGQALLDQIRSVTDKPLTHIINTHTHGDHVGSNAFFPANVEVIAQENTKTNMEKMDAFKSAEGKAGLPDRTFKDRTTLFSGNDAVDLYYFGGAHTGGDAFVVFRQARVLHAGDAFARKGLPIIDAANGGSGVAYPDTIAKAVATIKDVDKIITGHSTVMNWPDLAEYGEFNRAFLDYARAALAAGKSAQQAAAELKLPEKFSGYDVSAGTMSGPERNLTTVFAELRK